ncbi:hypothetical protein C2845_PM12G04490 [Panicum miliaceum]|uniref:FAS1 domain-containing protein n=1 Tax=Panicum miliaceum TaxID=4540 RepID=A0A3L6QHR4_PANMI|nr:hypothetical protein C2845_PM12G04490 [Panicum miliaceum]
MAPCSKLPPLLVTLAVLLPAPRSLGAGFGVGAGTIDVTKVLAGFPEFSTFSSMLTETKVALAISNRDKVTVLAPDNTAVAAAFGGTLRVPRSLLADLLALHVVLDYIDEPRLGALQHDRKGEGSVATTLLQVLGAPPRGVGFLRIYSGDGGRAMLSSAAPRGLGRNATVDKLVTAKPYSVAVLQVSGFVVPPGIRVQRAFPPRASGHMAAPPRKPATSAPAPAPVPMPVPAPAPGPALAPSIGSGPLVPSPMKPVPTPNLVDTPAPVPQETEVIPIPSVHGGLAAKVPSAAGRSTASWWSGIAAVVVGMTKTTCLHLHL